MKKVFILLIFIPTIILSQEKGKLKLSVDFGTVFPKGKTDFSAAAELKYNITQKFNIGFRLEGAGIGKEITHPNGEKVISDVRLSTGYIATFNYFLKNTKDFSPFVGGGIGYYKPSNISEGTTTINPILLDSEYGFLLRTGVELDKLYVVLNYHIIPSSQFEIGDLKQKAKNSYFGISIGYSIGGGKH